MSESSDRSATEDRSAGWLLSTLSQDETRREAYLGFGIGLAGILLCLAATAWLASVYPDAWRAAGNDGPVVVTSLAGGGLLAIATGWRLLTRGAESGSRDSGSVRLAPDAEADADGAVTDGSGAQSDGDASPESALVWVPVGEE